MQIKEYEAYTLKECLQQVRDDLGPEAVILETRKVRKGGMLGMRQREAVCIVAATGISVKDDLRETRSAPTASTAALSASGTARAKSSASPVTASSSKTGSSKTSSSNTGSNTGTILREPPHDVDERSANRAPARNGRSEGSSAPARPTPSPTAGQSAAISAARIAYTRLQADQGREEETRRQAEQEEQIPEYLNARTPAYPNAHAQEIRNPKLKIENFVEDQRKDHREYPQEDQREDPREDRRFTLLEQAMREIREGLSALQRAQKESHERTVSAVVSAVTPAINAAGNMAQLAALAQTDAPRFPDLYARLTASGVSEGLAHELLDALPDFDAWSEEAQAPLAVSALRDLIGRRVSSSGPIDLTPGTLKAVALIGPTGVGKTTTIAKLAAHFALVEKKRVALLTMDTYRIAAVEQLKIYSQILDIPIGVAYSQAEVAPVVAQYADFDLLLIDTAGRSQKNIMQVGELKGLLEAVGCETHLVLSAQTKEQDMIETAQRFSAARVDRLIFSKLDETDSMGTLLNVADRTGIPLSYLTTGQKVPEDLELANGGKLAGLLLD